jgi:hypothetical protein
VKNLTFVVFLLLWLVLYVQRQSVGPVAHSTPALAADLQPGHDLPNGLLCRLALPDVYARTCVVREGLTVVTKRDVIQHVYLLTYPDGLRIGQVMLDWGAPIGISRGWASAVEVIWPDKTAYVVVQPSFSPLSRVGFLSFGKPTSPFTTWRGYQSE